MAVSGKFAVVHFTEENKVSAVPVNWLIPNGCWWPDCAATQSHLVDLIKNCTPPTNGWNMYRARILRDGFGKYHNFFKLKILFNLLLYIYCESRIYKTS